MYFPPLAMKPKDFFTFSSILAKWRALDKQSYVSCNLVDFSTRKTRSSAYAIV